MKKSILYIVIVILIIVAGYFLFFNKETWQGVYYSDGDLLNEENIVYSPVFQDFTGCKRWVESKQTSQEDKYSCAKNCKNPEFGLQTCKEVVRNWRVTPDSITFDNYKE